MKASEFINEAAIGTNPKRPAREGSRPARGHNPEARYKDQGVIEAPGYTMPGFMNPANPISPMSPVGPVGIMSPTNPASPTYSGRPENQVKFPSAKGDIKMDDWSTVAKELLAKGMTDQDIIKLFVSKGLPERLAHAAVHGGQMESQGSDKKTFIIHFADTDTDETDTASVIAPDIHTARRIFSREHPELYIELIRPAKTQFARHDIGDEAQLDELSPETLKSYIKKSKGHSQKYDRLGDKADEKGDEELANKMWNKGDNRYAGDAQARNKLADLKDKKKGVAEAVAQMEAELAEHGKASRELCKSSKPDADLGASMLASCKSQGLRARDGDKSHKLGKTAKSRVKVGGHRIKGQKYGGPLPDWS